ncbi:MAG: aspartate aminotransferase family protein [Chloroflexi bacterium]|nr:aspartate aminotransferase family protein [Chloroflexota bacterium]MCI0901053.1 aspartate aminotransferase family protein [Chloroflexota bacterium]
MAESTSELERYLRLTPKSKALWEDAKNYLPGGDSRNSIFWAPYPIFVDHASGCHVVDSDGVDRLDFIGTMTTLVLGHSPKPVVDAVQEQMSKGMVYNAPSAHQVRLAKLLCERIPSFDLVRFTNSGTEATLNTIRAARAVTGKSKIAKVEGGYHGSHDQVSVSVRVDPAKAGERSRPDSVAATEGLGDGTLDQVVVMPFNETAVARKILEEHKDELAAVIIEPMLGSVGMLPATTEYLSMLREFTRDNGIILIFDEVISYRASMGGAQEYYGITPDMTSLGKIIGGGFSIGAFGGSKEIMDLYDPTAPGGPRVAHAGTFNANPVTMLAGAATLEQLTPEVYRKLAEMTEYLRAGILAVGAELETPVQVTGLGSLFGIHFTSENLVGYRDIATEDPAFRHQVFLGLLNEGIMMAANLVGAVSTEIGEDEIDAFTAALRRVLERARTPSE